MEERKPTLRQRELSMRLRRLREDREFSVGQVAEQLMCSATKVSRIETGARRVSLRDVRDLCQIYAVGEQETAQLMDLARRAREDGWWARYDDLGVGPYFDLEQEAKAITYYSMSYIYGLLQSDDYARAIIRSVYPLIDDQVLKERVEARMRRQELLERVVASEKVIVQIVPFSSGAQASSDSNMTLFEFGDVSVPDIVHVEGLISAQFLDRRESVERYREVLDNLRDAALSPKESQVLITEIKDAHVREA
jgi:transcriptional regulator with XRE-family HTH domain